MADTATIDASAKTDVNQYYRNIRPEIIPFLPRTRTRALEIGCGEGFFLGSIGGTNETWAVEANPDAAQRAQSRIGRVLIGDFESMRNELPKAYFDLVICNDVIEHMVDHDRFLHQIKEHIAPGGCLVGSIPNVRYYKNMFEFLLEKDWRYRDSGTLDVTHLRFFTEKSLRFALGKSGFKIEVLQGINPFFDKTSQRDKIYMFATRIISLITFGHSSDLPFLQFAFRATIKQ
jgi:2-polyprenyl-3-methyl-5-hydroxy-6-metoxy-1,4-benzoquinol methylase